MGFVVTTLVVWAAQPATKVATTMPYHVATMLKRELLVGRGNKPAGDISGDAILRHCLISQPSGSTLFPKQVRTPSLVPCRMTRAANGRRYRLSRYCRLQHPVHVFDQQRPDLGRIPGFFEAGKCPAPLRSPVPHSRCTDRPPTARPHQPAQVLHVGPRASLSHPLPDVAAPVQPQQRHDQHVLQPFPCLAWQRPL